MIFEKMNQQCKVCGEPAAGFHFGAFTCEGCKSFFGRTYNNLSSISECKNNGECVINKKNRTACKACRLRKCLFVGMSKSGSRYGRRSNWFKIHCLLQEQQQQHQQQRERQNDQLVQPPLQQQTNQHLPSQQPQQQQQQQLPYVHANQLSYSPNSNKKASFPQNSCLLANPFLSVSHLIDNNIHSTDKKSGSRHRHHHHHHHHRTSSSSSDSGASSADPEDSSVSNKEISESPVSEPRFSSNKPLTKFDSIRSISEPLNSFLVLPNIAISSNSPLSSSATTLISRPFVMATNSDDVGIQDEPIDLSVKSMKRRRTESPPKLNPSIETVPKFTPLDLTLVRTDTLSG